MMQDVRSAKPRNCNDVSTSIYFNSIATKSGTPLSPPAYLFSVNGSLLDRQCAPFIVRPPRIFLIGGHATTQFISTVCKCFNMTMPLYHTDCDWKHFTLTPGEGGEDNCSVCPFVCLSIRASN